MPAAPVTWMVAKRGHNHRHLDRIRRRGGLDAALFLAGLPGFPALSRDARNYIPLDAMLAVHLSRRMADRPMFFSRAWLRRPYLATLRFYARWLHLSWLRKLQRARPDAVVLWNGHRMPESAVKTAADRLGITVIHIENGCLPNTRTVDARGVNADSAIPRDPAFYRRQPQGEDKDWQLVPRNWHRSKDAPRDSEAWLPERFLFVPFQVDTDSQLVLHSPWIADMRQLVEVLRAARPHLGDIDIVFKEHPSSPYHYDDLHAALQDTDGLLFRNSVSTQELIEKSVGVLTINSTVGIEALLFRKPVITVGDAFYNMPGLVLHAENPAALARAFESVATFVPDEALRRGLVHYLRTEYCVPKSAAGEDDWRAMADRIRTLAAGGQEEA